MAAPRTLNELFLTAMDRGPAEAVVLRAARGGRWVDLTRQEVYQKVRDAALGLKALGLRPGDRVAILSENRPEWAISDYACLTARCIAVPIYPTLPPAQMAYLLRDAGAAAVCVSSPSQMAKLRAVRAELPALRQAIVFDPEPGTEDALSFDSLLARGRAAAAGEPAWRAEALAAAPDDLATLIYTSGTTGDPKGVMLTHGNIASNVRAALQAFSMGPGDECLSFLPLSHVFERTAGHFVMLWAGVVINYARGMDLVADDLRARRPTVVTSVPRLYEKIHARVREAAGASRVGRGVLRWATAAGGAWVDRRLGGGGGGGRPVPLGLALRHRLADRLVFARVRRQLGGRIRLFISGGAPLSAEIARFFHAAGMPVLEGYGLTETSPVITLNTLGATRLGSVGRPIPGVEVRIAEDGEILTRGPHVMRGYYGKPEATAEALDPEGWFHTGDIGRLDPDGYLFITDRKKDLIVTAGGKNIAPQPIEHALRANPFIANAIVLGDRRKFPIALLVPDFERLGAWARAEGVAAGADGAALARDPAVRRKLEAEAKKHLRALAHFEVPKKFLVLPRDLSLERGELTAKLSVRRRVVEAHFAGEIEALYAEPAHPE